MRLARNPVFALSVFFGLSASSSLATERVKTLSDRVDGFVALVFDRYERRVHEEAGTYLGLDRASTTPPLQVVLREHASRPYGAIDIHRRLWITAYSFDSQASREAALESWCDCFSILCDPIPCRKPAPHAKLPTVIAIINPTSIIVVKTNCEAGESGWDRDRRDIESSFGEGDYTVLEHPCGGPVSWRSATAK